MSPEPKPAASTGQGWEGLNLPPEQEQTVADAAASYIASPWIRYRCPARS